MKRISKILAVILLVLVVVGVCALWFLNRWLHSPELHAQMEQELGKALRMQVKLQSVNVDLFGQTQVSGITIPQKNENFFQATGFTARHQVSALLFGRLVLDDILVESPTFSIRENDEGDWLIPRIDKPKKPKSAEEKLNDETAKDVPRERWDSKVEIKRVRLLNGSTRVFDVEGREIMTFSGVNIVVGKLKPDEIEGSMTAEKADFAKWGMLEKITAGFSRTEQKGIIIPRFTAQVGGGKVAGGFSQKPDEAATWSFKLEMENVDTMQAFSAEALLRINVSGIVSGNLELRGAGDDEKLIKGKGVVLLKNAHFREMEIVREVGTLLGISDAANFAINEAKLDAVIGNERIFVNEFSIAAPPLTIKSKGVAKFDSKLNLDAQLLVKDEMLRQRPSIDAQFSPSDGSGLRGVSFEIRGNWKKPKHNLMERVTGTKSKRMQKFILGEAILLGPNGINVELNPPEDEDEPKTQEKTEP